MLQWIGENLADRGVKLEGVMKNGERRMTKTMLFGRAWLLLGLLAVGLVISACRTTPDVEPPAPVGVAKTDDPTPVPLAETTEPVATPTKTVEPTATDTPRPTPDASRTTPTPIPGAQMAPDFSLPDLDGQTWTLSQFRGRPVMLFVWATW
jgi:hypothetical protein